METYQFEQELAVWVDYSADANFNITAKELKASPHLENRTTCPTELLKRGARSKLSQRIRAPKQKWGKLHVKNSTRRLFDIEPWKIVVTESWISLSKA